MEVKKLVSCLVMEVKTEVIFITPNYQDVKASINCINLGSDNIESSTETRLYNCRFIDDNTKQPLGCLDITLECDKEEKFEVILARLWDEFCKSQK